MSTCSPVAIAGQACVWTSVGPSNADANQSRTVGVKPSSATTSRLAAFAASGWPQLRGGPPAGSVGPVSVRTMAAVVAGLALGLCAPSVAAACSLPAPPDPPPPPSALIKDYDVAVYGVVASVRLLPSTTPPGQPVSADQRFVATRPRDARVQGLGRGARSGSPAGTSGATCGFGIVAPRQRVALRLDKPSNPYGVSIVSRVTLDGLLAATGGRWHRPAGSDHGGATASPARSRASRKTVVDHRRRQLAGERVLLAGVKAAEQQRRGGRASSTAPWPKRGRGRGTGTPRAASRRSAASQANAPRQTITRTSREQLELARRVRQARVALGRRRLVRRRRAAHRRRDPGVAQRQPVAGVHRRRLVGEARAVQRGEQEVARAVAGEHAAGAVGAVRRRRQAEDQHARVGIAEAGDRPAPVLLARRTTRASRARRARATPRAAGTRGSRRSRASSSARRATRSELKKRAAAA